MKTEKENMIKNTEDQRLIKIANKIKDLRIQKGYSSHENFTWDNNLNRIQYWRIEKWANITLKIFLSILDIHKISLNSFFSDTLRYADYYFVSGRNQRSKKISLFVLSFTFLLLNLYRDQNFNY